MSELAVGHQAPAFSLPDQTGKIISLDDFAGETVILYFYPKDDTPGCTAEACSFRNSHELLVERGLHVLGISPDSVKSHAKFAEKFQLPYPLLADEGHQVAEAYGMWVEKSMYGRKYMGVERTTFIIDGTGTVAAIHRKVKPSEHVGELLGSL
jgi:peroxiredoxin Q/BCP